MVSVSPQRMMCHVGVVAAAGLLALSLLVVPAAAEAGKGDGARYEYKISQFDYNATGSMTAARGQECEANRTASWVGLVETTPSDLAPLGKLGVGHLRIHGSGAKGEFAARTEVVSNLGSAEHTLVTECCPPGGTPSCDEGQQTATSTTPCKEGPTTSEVGGGALIRGGVGNKVNLNWDFQQFGVAGAWMPDSFRCVEPLEFAYGTCTSRAKLSAFTEKKVKLPFRCSAQNFTPPPGDYYQYGAISSASGFVVLARTKQS